MRLERIKFFYDRDGTLGVSPVTAAYSDTSEVYLVT